MRQRYWQAAAMLILGAGSVIWAALDGTYGADPRLVLGAAAVPLAILLYVMGRTGFAFPTSALFGGAGIGIAVALLTYAAVSAFAYAFFYGFAETAVDMLDTLGVDGGFTSVLGSPWTIFLMIEMALVAPLTEETGKALGARFAKPTSRQTAFMAGVAAGVGFAIAEDISYALGSSWFGISWEAMVTVRMAGSAVHPLASGLVVMGWWEYRQNRDFSLLVNRFLAGAGVHALWNGSLVALGAVTAAFSADPDASYEFISLAHTSLLGIAAAAILWRMTSALADDEERLISLRSGEARVIAGWTILAASFLVPSAMLMLVFQSV